MALSVTPTSGEAPYTLSLDMTNKSLVDGVRYDLEVRSSVSVGACNVPVTPPSEGIRFRLLQYGYSVRSGTIPEGSCLVYKVDLIDLSDSSVIDTQSVSVDNT